MPDIEKILSEKLPSPSSLFDEEQDNNFTAAEKEEEKKEKVRRFFYALLYVDVRSGRAERTKLMLEGYFGGFYINLLRQLLELDGFTCEQRERKLIESRTTERKVDLLVRYKERNILNLESAMNGTPAKIRNDRGKVAMEVYHVWKADASNRLHPPLGVLLYPSDATLSNRKTGVFEVYTTRHVDGVPCLVTLDVFVAPVDSVDKLNRGRQVFDECKHFDSSLPIDFDFERNTQLFVSACDGINRIVQACKALKKQCDDNLTAKSVSSTATEANSESGGGDGGSTTGFRAPGGTFSQTTETVPARTPKKRNSASISNCCCAKYEIHSVLERTDWSEVSLAIHPATGQQFVCKREQRNKGHIILDNDDDQLCGNAFDTEVSVFMKLATACTSCATLVKPIDVCSTDRCIFMEELNEVDWKRLQSNPRLALNACLDILQGVSALHEINVAHCDLKAGAVMVRRGGADGGGGDDKCFVLCDFNLAVVNADQFDHSRMPFGSDGWSLRSHRFIRASAKDHDCFSLGLLIATSCYASAHEIVEENGDVCYRDSLTHLIETARVNNDLIRFGILEVAFSLCLLEISIHDALQKLQTLHAGLLEGPREKTSAVRLTDASKA